MTIPADLAVQAAIIARLRADPALGALVGARIFDHVPEREAFPYVSLRTTGVREWDTGSDFGKAMAVEINAWSRLEGRREAKLILHAVETSLRAFAPAVLTDHRLVTMAFEMADVLREEGGQTYFGYARFRAVTEEL